jgi:hypothetical protein
MDKCFVQITRLFTLLSGPMCYTMQTKLLDKLHDNIRTRPVFHLTSGGQTLYKNKRGQISICKVIIALGMMESLQKALNNWHDDHNKITMKELICVLSITYNITA